MKRVLLITSTILLNALATNSMAAGAGAIATMDDRGVLGAVPKVNPIPMHGIETDSCDSVCRLSITSESSESVVSGMLKPTLPTADQLFDALINKRCSEEMFWKTLENIEFDIRGYARYEDAPIIKAINTRSDLLPATFISKLFEVEASIVDDTTARQESVFHAILASRRNEKEKDILLTAALSALKKDWAYSTPEERAKFLEDRKVQAMIDATGSRRLVWTYALFLASERK